MATAKQVLWELVELAFLAVLVLLLAHVLLGAAAGSYVDSVADNVTKFATGAGGGLLGVVIVLAILYLVLGKSGWTASSRK